MTVGKIWYEATREEQGRPAWDAIVVDAPATGHGLQYLRMPQAARDTFGAGLVQREATRIVELLRDPRTHRGPPGDARRGDAGHRDARGPCRSSPVRSGMPVGHVVVNRLHRRRFAPRRAGAARRRRPRVGGEQAGLLAAVAERAAEEDGLGDDQRAAPGSPARGAAADRRSSSCRSSSSRSSTGRRSNSWSTSSPPRSAPAHAGASDEGRRDAGASWWRATASSSAAGSGGVGKTTRRGVDRALGCAAGPAHGRDDDRPRAPPRRARSASRSLGNEPREIPAAVFAAQGMAPRGSLAAMMLDQKGAWDALVERHAPAEVRERILANRVLPAPVADASPARRSTWRSSSSACSPTAGATT